MQYFEADNKHYIITELARFDLLQERDCNFRLFLPDTKLQPREKVS